LAGYSTAEVSDLVGLKPTQVRHYVRRDLLNPVRGSRGEYQFSFQDVVMLRSAKELLDASVPVRKTNRILLELKRRRFDTSRPLSSLRVRAEGARVLVRDGYVSWDAETGQGSLFGMLDVSVAPEVVDSVKIVKLDAEPLVKVKEVNELTSDDWYNLALDLEEIAPERAPEAYRRALEQNPDNADAQVNLGRLFQLRGDLKKARRYYQLALDSMQDHQLANYNMGTIFDELDQFETAVGFYAKATSIPDAHYNLARMHEVRGDELAALRHMRLYRNLLEP
jgi:tetratricopeptide (TPR) repeat protein